MHRRVDTLHTLDRTRIVSNPSNVSNAQLPDNDTCQRAGSSMATKPCIDCGEPTSETRCDDCYVPHHGPQAGTAHQQGYDARWTRLSRRARRLQPFCTDCGADTDLQADHSPQAWRRRDDGLPIRLIDIDVVCGPCNRARGPARRPGEDPPSPRPESRRGKPQIPSDTTVCSSSGRVSDG